MEELSDVVYALAAPSSWDITNTADQLGGMTSGKAYEASSALAVSPFSSQGDDLKADVRAWVATLTFPVDLTYVFDGVETIINTTGTSDEWDLTGAYRPRLSFFSSSFSSDAHVGQSVYIKEFAQYQGTTSVPPLNGEVLVYNSTDSEWQPGAVAFGDLNGIDVSTTPPSDGQLLKWDNASSTWKPGSPGSVQNLDDVAYASGSTPTWNLTLTADQLGGMTSGEGYEAADSLSIHPTDAQAVDRKADIRAWVATLSFPASLTFLFNGVETAVNVTGVLDQADSSGGYRPRFLISFDTASSDAHVGETLQIKELTEYLGITQNPADGQVLTWVNANNRWEPANASGGGGGAVTSVNGQTGVVSVGIADMDDVEYPIIPGANNTTLTNKTSDNATPNAQEWAINNPGGNDAYLVWNTTSVDAANLENIQLNDAVSFSAPGVSDHVTTCSAAPADNNVNSRFIRIADPWPAEWLALADGTAAIIYHSSFNPTVGNPTDGQVLVWSGANNAWEPTTLPGDAVDSVNGQTGVVALDVRDMGDYADPLGAQSYYFTGTQDAAFPVSNINDYGCRPSTPDYFAWLSTNTEAHALLSASQIGEAVTFTWDSGEVMSTTVGTTPALNGSDEWFFRVGDEIFSGTIPTGPMRVAFPDRALVPTTPENNSVLTYNNGTFTPNFVGVDSLTDVDTSTTAPTDGQVLTWVGANSQWEPGDYISKATLQAEVAAATDFADFQARIAAL